MNSKLVCRVCANVSSAEEELLKFDAVSSIYYRLTALQPSEAILPDGSCRDCYDKLLLFDGFRTMCLDAYDQLSNRKVLLPFGELKNIKKEIENSAACEPELNQQNPADVLEVKMETYDNLTASDNDDSDSKEDYDIGKDEEVVGEKSNTVQTISASTRKKSKGSNKIHCEQCDMFFFNDKRYQQHVQVHHGLKPVACEFCRHTNEKLYPCELCEAVFNSSGNKSRHVRLVHQGVKDFKCTYCDRAFGKAETLKHHVMIHTGEKPHACDLCGRRFIQLVALQKHMRTHNKQLQTL